MLNRRLIALLAALLSALMVIPATAQTSSGDPDDEIPHLVMFTRTDGYRHASIEHSVDVVRDIAAESNVFTVEHTEDTADFTAELFARTDVILFSNTTGEHPFSDEQKAMFEKWVSEGGGFMGVHAAADTNYEWDFYQTMVGAAFDSHPHTGGSGIDLFDLATVQVERPDHPIHYGTSRKDFELREEYYRWRSNPRGTQDVQVLLSLDETSTYGFGGSGNGISAGPVISAYDDDQPLSWVKSATEAAGSGRVWYTNLGHYEETYDRDEWRTRFLNALMWVDKGYHYTTPDEPAPGPGLLPGVLFAPYAASTTGFAPPLVVIQQGGSARLLTADNGTSHNVIARDRDPATRRPVFTSPFATVAGDMVDFEGEEKLPPGDYEFFCSIHGSMEGTLTVVE